MTSPLEILGQWWNYYRERPFLRLVRIFTERIFRGGGDSDAEGVDLGVGLALTLLALPGGFISVLTFVKYSTFLSWMRGTPHTDVLAAALPDEYFFITLSIAVTGAVAVWRWDALFPDRRDYINLVALPVSTFTIFSANLVAVLFLAGLIALDVNAASSLLFPLGVGATQSSFLFFLKFFGIHVALVGLAGIFGFLAVLSLLGGLITILPAFVARKVSPLIRSLVVMSFIVLVSTSYATIERAAAQRAANRAWLVWLPPCWFAGMFERLHGRTSPLLSAASHLALPALGLAITSAFLFYALGYRRYFLRTAEIAEASPRTASGVPGRLAAVFDQWILRTPFQRGCFPFVWRTLFRNEAHRLALAGIFGSGIVLSSQVLAGTAPATSSETSIPADVLAVPFVLAFFMIVGLRLIFEIPADLRPNWIFRFTLDAQHHECATLARKVMLAFVLPWLVLIALPLYSHFDGWLVAVLHTLLVGAWSVLLTNAVLVRFRKLPFTSTLPVFQQHSIVTLFGGALGLFLFAVVTPQAEARALVQPVWMLAFLPAALLFWYIPRKIEEDDVGVEKRLLFEDAPSSAVEVLHLGD